jgi:hypothetical protein
LSSNYNKKAGSLLASLLASWLAIGGFLLGIDSIESIHVLCWKLWNAGIDPFLPSAIGHHFCGSDFVRARMNHSAPTKRERSIV